MKTKALMLAAAPLLMLGACNVSQDDTNDTTTLTVDEAQVEDTVEDAGNLAERAATEAGEALENAAPVIENTAETIGERAERAGERIENQVERVDVDVNVRNTN